MRIAGQSMMRPKPLTRPSDSVPNEAADNNLFIGIVHRTRIRPAEHERDEASLHEISDSKRLDGPTSPLRASGVIICD